MSNPMVSPREIKMHNQKTKVGLTKKLLRMGRRQNINKWQCNNANGKQIYTYNAGGAQWKQIKRS